jgi:UDP-glucose/iron transport system ATP-binding protein
VIEATDPVFQFENVSFSYPGGKALFHELSLDMKTGRFYHLRGPSGSGKSSLLRLMIRLEQPTQGQIRFKGTSLAEYYPPHLRRAILYIPQTPVATDDSVQNFLKQPFTFKANQDLTAPDDRQLRDRLSEFQLLGIRLRDHVQTLSVGQLQRLSFIRGLLLSPDVLLLDEPTSALDQESADILENQVQVLCGQFSMTVLLVSHREMRNMTTNYHSLILRNGKIM